jgi:hypothetical protein
MFEVNKRWSIDGSPRWNVARYINHSCRPNAKPVGRKGGIVIVALRQIEPGEEITYDYGREYLKCFLDDGGVVARHVEKSELFSVGERTHPTNERNNFAIWQVRVRSQSCLRTAFDCKKSFVL